MVRLINFARHMQNIIFDCFAWLVLTSLPTPYG